MPKSETPSGNSRHTIRLPFKTTTELDNSSMSKTARSRKVRSTSRRKGRPPGSRSRAHVRDLGQLKYESSERELESSDRESQQHPSTGTHHGYNGGDENKPREERSYLEFFPFLNTSTRLEIVSSQPLSSSTPNGAVSNDTLTAAARPNSPKPDYGPVKKELVVENVDQVLGKSRQGSQDLQQDGLTVDGEVEGTVEKSAKVSDPVEQTQAETRDKNLPEDNEVEMDTDAEGVSDPDVFFDAKGAPDPDVFFDARGFPESTSESIPLSYNGSSVELINGESMDAIDTTLPEAPGSVSGSAALGLDRTVSDGGDAVNKTNTDSRKPLEGKSTARDKQTPSEHLTISTTKPPEKGAQRSLLEPKTPMSLLPKSSFRLIPRDDDDELEEYHLPVGHNVRYIEPTETELAERVEYDMDEQDEFWLKEINEERRKKDLGEVSSAMFEKIFDRLEKEWFDLTKNIPKPTENLPPEDSACNICDDGECENSNAIVFCDGCNLAVHQDCYGIPYIPEGQWLCRNRWAHLLCANWIPEVGVANTVYMEPIDSIDKIPASRWKLTCYICKIRMGACIQCETKNCFRAFHVTCARKAHLYMKSKLTKVGSAAEALVYRAHCHKHTPRDHKAAVDLAGAAAAFSRKGLKRKRVRAKIMDDDSDDPDFDQSEGDEESTTDNHAGPQASNRATTSKAALAHQKHYTPGAPLAPMYIVNRLLPFVTRLSAKTSAARKTSALSFLYTICKYWSLKRESRRGAPLLKRLHLEPWTASATAHRQTEEEKLKKLQTLMHLRGDVEKVRMLAELVRKRERAKLRRQELQNRYLCKIMFPLKTILEDTLVELEKFDKQKFFAYPISAEEVKDYHEVIKNPICFQTMTEKLNAHLYQTVDEFVDDARRIYTNCLLYNKVDTPYYRSAMRQSKLAEPLLQKAKEDYARLDIDPRTGFLNVPIDPEIFSYNIVPFQHAEEVVEGGETNQPATPVEKPASEKVTATKNKTKDVTGGTAKAPFVMTRTLRATKVRSASAVAPTTAATKVASSTQSSETRKSSTGKVSESEAIRKLNQGPGFRASTKSPMKPEAPKLKTATVTRADVARARQQGEDSAKRILEDEDEMLEKLRTKSKKSRSIAVNLQSKLKPSIVDKAVVINKPAPKGWAYVVVEGEDDTSEDEGEDEGEGDGGGEGRGIDEGAEGEGTAKGNVKDKGKSKGKDKSIDKDKSKGKNKGKDKDKGKEMEKDKDGGDDIRDDDGGQKENDE
ncbi:nuA3 HAT complex component nto1 [Podila epigama]|nr:nuA3 HAT complex component nto1 [Podila epigama]